MAFFTTLLLSATAALTSSMQAALLRGLCSSVDQPDPREWLRATVESAGSALGTHTLLFGKESKGFSLKSLCGDLSCPPVGKQRLQSSGFRDVADHCLEPPTAHLQTRHGNLRAVVLRLN